VVGRTRWAHLEFTLINITPTILPKKIEDAREAGATLVNAAAFIAIDGLRTAPPATPLATTLQRHMKAPQDRDDDEVRHDGDDARHAQAWPKRPARLLQQQRKDKKSGSEGSTSQKMLFDSLATAWQLPLSKYSPTKASSDVSGRDANTAPQKELRLPSSATANERRHSDFTGVLPHHCCHHFDQRVT
jgi:hypothetical protein